MLPPGKSAWNNVRSIVKGRLQRTPGIASTFKAYLAVRQDLRTEHDLLNADAMKNSIILGIEFFLQDSLCFFLFRPGPSFFYFHDN